MQLFAESYFADSTMARTGPLARYECEKLERHGVEALDVQLMKRRGEADPLPSIRLAVHPERGAVLDGRRVLEDVVVEGFGERPVGGKVVS